MKPGGEGTGVGVGDRLRQPESWRALPLRRRAALLLGARPQTPGESSAALDHAAHMRTPAGRAVPGVAGLVGLLAVLLMGQLGDGSRAGPAIGFVIGWTVVVGLINFVVVPDLRRRAQQGPQ